MGTFRAASILTGFFGLTVPLMPVQALLLKVSPKGARRFPHWYHRQVCKLFGIKLNIEGAVVADKPVLLISNHTSWLDITVLSAVAPLSFVAKKDVARWPFVSSLARLQRTVFVDRERRSAVGETTNEIMARLASGDTVVLFAEGTSSDGNRVLPFKTSLFAAAIDKTAAASEDAAAAESDPCRRGESSSRRASRKLLGGGGNRQGDALSGDAGTEVAVGVDVAEVFGIDEERASGAASVAGDAGVAVGLVDFRDRVGDVGDFLQDLVTQGGQTGDEADDDDRVDQNELGLDHETGLFLHETSEQRHVVNLPELET